MKQILLLAMAALNEWGDETHERGSK